MAAPYSTFASTTVGDPVARQLAMAQVRQALKQGMDAEDVARTYGVDRLVVDLWSKIPDDLWEGFSASVGGDATQDSGATPVVLPLSRDAALTARHRLNSPLNKVVVCAIPFALYKEMRSTILLQGGDSLLESAITFLGAALDQVLPARTMPGRRSVFLSAPLRPLALPVSGEYLDKIGKVADAYFGGNLRCAAGWLIARGAGMRIALPSTAESAELRAAMVPQAEQEQEAEQASDVLARIKKRRSYKAYTNKRQRIDKPQNEQADVPEDVPTGGEIRALRESISMSQREAAALAGISRGSLHAMEVGARRNPIRLIQVQKALLLFIARNAL